MHRRIFLGGTTAGLLTLLSACGGSDDDNDIVDSLDPIEEPGGHEHIDGIASLPESASLDTALLAEITPGTSFVVQVNCGAQVCAGASVEVFDIQGNLIDRGTTDTDGRFRSVQIGRKFLMARANVGGLGTLYGFELNTIGKSQPTIDVNLLPTLLQRLNERETLTPDGAEFLAKTFLGIDHDALITDPESLIGQFDQERVRLHFANSGLTLSAYIDQVVDQMMAALHRGLHAPESTEYRLLLGKAAVPDVCKDLPIYDDSWSDDFVDPFVERLKPYVIEHWPAATKGIVTFILKKIAEASGYAFITPVGELILNNVLPGKPNPEMEALKEIQNQLRVITTSLQAMMSQFKEAEFNRLYDEVRNTFSRIDAIATDMSDTQAYYTRNQLPTDSNYNDLVISRCESLFALETSLIEAENKFLGLGAFAGAGLLNRWHTIYRGRPFYTAIVQKQYMDLLNYYVNWMNRVYAFIINAYTAYAQTKGIPVNINRLNQLRDRVVAQVELLEKMRPKYLLSEKLVFDLEHGLAWVGRGNVATDFRTFIPADFGDNHYKRRDISMFLQIGYEENNPCREYILGSPVRDSSIREDLVNAFNWRLPTKNDMERSFGSRIKARYGKKFNLTTFLWDLDIPLSFNLFKEDGNPAYAIIRDGMVSKRTRVSRGVIRYYLWISVYRLYDLGIASFPNHASYKPIHDYYFPVATVPRSGMAPYLPWDKYDSAIASRPEVLH